MTGELSRDPETVPRLITHREEAMRAIRDLAFLGLLLAVILIAARYILWWSP